MSCLRKIVSIIVFSVFLSSSLFFFPKFSSIQAEQSETQNREQLTCYSQCTAYKFFWQGDFCYDMFANMCAEKVGVKDAITFIKNVSDLITKNKLIMWVGVDKVFKAWFMCKPLIEDCIVPQLNNCRQVCQSEPKYYAPDLSVGHPDGRFRGIIYDEGQRKLYFKVVNNGMAYAWDIEVEASYGHTADRDGHIQASKSRRLFKDKIEHLIYLGARNGPPKTAGDYIGDFLIDEALAGKYLKDFKSWLLSDFKSDSKNYSVPSFWMKELYFMPIDGELNQIILNVDPSNLIEESNEKNNTFILNIDLRPTPSQFSLENFSYQLVEQTLNDFLVGFKIKNNGDESGQAIIKIYEDSEQNPPIFHTEPVITGKGIAGGNYSVDTIINIDTTKETNLYCGKSKKYILTITNQETNEKITKEFELPIHVGGVWGRVVDLFNRPVAGVTIKSSTGQQVQTSKNGFYHLVGINNLGKFTVTATHPEFSQESKKELELKVDNFYKVCDEGKINFTGVNFVMKDVDVMFKVTVKDTNGNVINAHLIASNKDFRLEEDVNDKTPLPGLQPGQYFFTVSAPGYKTIGQTVNAVPQDLDLEFILERLNGRSDDSSLTITQPKLLWEMNRGEEIFVDMRATKDGKTVIIYTSRNKPNTGKLYFLESLTGSQRAVVSTISNGGQSFASIDTSYDGNTTALCSNDGKTYGKDRGKNWLKLFNATGASLGQMEYGEGSTSLCEVSPDGFFILPCFLVNKGFHIYTDFEILGPKHDKTHMTYGSYRGTIFTPQNNIFRGCSAGNGFCLETLNNIPIYSYGQTDAPVFSDSSQNGEKIAMISYDKALLFSGNQKLWEKTVKNIGRYPLSISISPGGNFVIYTTVTSTSHRTIKIITNNNVDRTPAGIPTNKNENVLYVSANDKGIFYMTQEGKKLRYYQVGNYKNDYNPPTPVPTNKPPLAVAGLSYWDNGIFKGVGPISFYQLLSNTIYMANQTLTFDMNNPWGNLKITEGTLFGVDQDHHAVVLKGQITAQFNSPATVYAIKFDRYDLNLFAQKLNQFIDGLLPEDEYFEIKNVHTKFTVTNTKNKINLAVDKGKVEISNKTLNKIIDSGKQISIDKNNKIRESIYLESKLYVIFASILIETAGIILFKYRKTPIVKKILLILKTVSIWLIKIINKLLLLIWIMIKKITQFIWKMFKKLIKKFFSKNK